MSCEAEGQDARVTAWVDVVDYYWQRASLNPADRQRLRADLMRDLAPSLSNPEAVESLIASDPAEFAAALAQADGVATKPLRPDPPATSSDIVLTMLGGAAAGFVAALLTVYPIGIRLMDQTSADYDQQGLIVLGLHVVAAAMSVLAAVGAVRWRFRFQVTHPRVLLWMGAVFGLGGAVSIAPAIALARSTGYSGSAEVVAVELAIVLGCCVAAARVSSRLLTRTRGVPRITP